ncbi:protein ren, partial [Escherichia coli]|nr:protein ren [Escherichia coli]
TSEEREGKALTNLIFKECRQSAAMKRVLRVYQRTPMGTQS